MTIFDIIGWGKHNAAFRFLFKLFGIKDD